MPATIENQKTQTPPDKRSTREPAPPPERKRSGALVLAGALLVAFLIIVAFVLAVTGGDDSSSSPAPAKSAAPAAAKPAAPAAAANIGVALKDFTVTPAPTAGLAGKVTFRVHNAGAVKHEFVVIRTRKPAASLLEGSEAGEAGNVGEIGDVEPGATKTLRLELKAGHYAAGQDADFVVK